jgi:peptidoglycan-associated lipoprotein
VGYGESSPVVVDQAISAETPFLKEGTVLTEEFINTLPNEEQKEIAHQINRRTEFRVLRTDYQPVKQ